MSNRSTPYERGLRAKRAGRLLESNPFARRAGAANERRASDWALGWHSGTAKVLVASDWQWPPLGHIPSPPEGDYGVRMRGLRALFLPRDPIEWEVLRAEMRLGVVEYVPGWAVVPYQLLWWYDHGIGEQCHDEPPPWFGHPMKSLWSAIRIQGGVSGRWCPLVVSAAEELSS